MKIRLLPMMLGIAPLLMSACGGTSSDVSGGGSGFAPPTLVSVRTFPTNAPLPLGYPLNINLVATFSDGSQAEVAAQGAWTSSNTSVTGVTGGAIQGAAPGNTTVTATFGGMSASTNVTVTQATLTSLEVTPANAQSVTGQLLGFLAAARFSDNTVVNVTNVAVWTSSNTTVATVNTQGVTNSLAEGNTTIGSSLNGRSGSGNLTVVRGTATGGFQGGFNGGGFNGGGFQGGGFQGGFNGGFQGGFQGGGGGFQGSGLNFNF